MGSEGEPVWSNPTEVLLQHNLQKKKSLLPMTDSCENTQCISACCVWGCAAVDRCLFKGNYVAAVHRQQVSVVNINSESICISSDKHSSECVEGVSTVEDSQRRLAF